MRLTSFGAADGVTGSKHLVEVGGSRLLLDCGLFQGLKLHRERNWQPLPIDVKSIDAVVISHADADELMAWMRQFEFAPRHTFVVHGDPDATDTLRFRIGNELGWRASVPPHAQTIEI